MYLKVVKVRRVNYVGLIFLFDMIVPLFNIICPTAAIAPDIDLLLMSCTSII